MDNTKYFTFNDLQEILIIKDRVIRTLLVGGGGGLSDEEKNKLDMLMNKAISYLERRG